MESITISIDGVNTIIEEVLPFYQMNPIPGNRVFALCIKYKSNEVLSKIIETYRLDDIENQNWSIFFLYLTGIWPEHASDKKTKYFINLIEEIEITSTTICLKGVASDIIKN